MSIDVIDLLKQKNNGTFPIADSNDLLGGFYQVYTEEERDAIPAKRRKEGMLCYVKYPKEMIWQLSGGIENSNWKKLNLGDGDRIKFCDEDPQEEENVIWVDMDEDIAENNLNNNAEDPRLACENEKPESEEVVLWVDMDEAWDNFNDTDKIVFSDDQPGDQALIWIDTDEEWKDWENCEDALGTSTGTASCNLTSKITFSNTQPNDSIVMWIDTDEDIDGFNDDEMVVFSDTYPDNEPVMWIDLDEDLEDDDTKVNDLETLVNQLQQKIQQLEQRVQELEG